MRALLLQDLKIFQMIKKQGAVLNKILFYIHAHYGLRTRRYSVTKIGQLLSLTPPSPPPPQPPPKFLAVEYDQCLF